MGDKSVRRIMCVGLVCTDIINVVSSYPKEDSDQRALELRWHRGGNASNMCTVLTQLKTPCEFLGSFAMDNNIGFLKGDFAEYNIPVDNCVYHENCTTPTSTVIINKENGSRTILHGNKNLPEINIDDFRKIDLSSKKYKWIHFEGRPNCSNIMQMLNLIDEYNSTLSDKSQRINTSVELEKVTESLDELQDKADVLFISKDYAQFKGYDDMEGAARGMASAGRHGSTVICAWGKEGAAAYSTLDSKLSKSKSFPPLAVIDTLGAGDTFNAATILSLTQKFDIDEAITFGCKVAGAKVGMDGFKGLKDVSL